MDAAQPASRTGPAAATGPAPRRFRRWVERLLAALILAGVGYSAWHLAARGYLPQPFFFDLDDSLIDGYSTAYYANHPGAYDVWKTVYPPLSFVLLKLVTLHRCYVDDDYKLARGCDWLFRAALFGLFALNVVLIHKAYRKALPASALSRTIAVGLGMPALYGFDRGNLVIPCLTSFILAYGDLLRSPRLRALAAASSMNLKPYLLVMLLPTLAKRQWTRLEYTVVGVVLVFVASFAIEGAGSPSQILGNILLFADSFTDGVASAISNFQYATTFEPLLRLFKSDAPLLAYFSSRDIEAWSAILSGAIRLGQLGFGLCCLAALFRAKALKWRRFAALTLAVLLSASDTSGGYSMIFLLFLVMFEPFRGVLPIGVVICAYLLCLPADYVITPVLQRIEPSYWTGRLVNTAPGVTVGDFLRPALVLLIQYGYVALNITDMLGGWRRAAATPVACVLPLPDGLTP
jgi:hypothetical protein